MNTPVSFELAKLLKEKGFNNPTEVFYWLEDELNRGVIHRKKTPRQGFFKSYGGSLLAPTITEVVMWLYEKHGLHIEILLAEDNPWDKFYYRILKVGQYFSLSHDGTYRDSPTEAYEAAIEYTLNNLI